MAGKEAPGSGSRKSSILPRAAPREILASGAHARPNKAVYKSSREEPTAKTTVCSLGRVSSLNDTGKQELGNSLHPFREITITHPRGDKKMYS